MSDPKSAGCIWFLMLLMKTTLPLVHTQSDVFNICDIERVKLHYEGQTGSVLFEGPNQSSSPCVLRLQALPNTYISITPENTFMFDKCYKSLTPSKCTEGCSFAYLFDGFYFNNTLTYVTDSNWEHFNTSSSVLYVAVCHSSATKVTMKLKYKTVERRHVIEGDSFGQNREGQITSPYFPNNYIQNGEQVTYQFISRIPTDKVVITFDDYDIAPGAALYFHPTMDYTSPIKITDESNRPIVVSSGNQLQFVFDNGWPAGSYRNYLGFKATYKFIAEGEFYAKPATYCGRYYMTLNGGEIELRPNRFNVPYDCVWVVKTQPGYKATYMKLDRFSSDYGNSIHPGSVSVDIHAGLTSNGTIVGTLYPSDYGLYREFDNKVGFYVRLRGSFRSATTFRLAFTSYTDFYASGCDTNTHFMCSSKKCIPNKLSCDHVEHCPDGTDETIGCSGRDNYQSSHETLTVSIIVPLVVSIFLLSVLCILFVLVRRCRQARQFNDMDDSLPSVSTSDRRRRGRRQDDFFRRPADAPPTYDEALITGIPVPDNDVGADRYDVPKPPPYSEAVDSFLVEESSIPSPPYYSRENLNMSEESTRYYSREHDNQSHVEDDIQSPRYYSREHVNHSHEEDDIRVCGSGGSSETGNIAHRHRNGRTKSRTSPGASNQIHLTSSGRLPNLPSAYSQSMNDVSGVNGRNNLSRFKSEQILSSTDLNGGCINLGFLDDQFGKTTNLQRDSAVSNRKSSKPSENKTMEKINHMSVPVADKANRQDKKGGKSLSARERLKPTNPELKKVYDEQLNKKEKTLKGIVKTLQGPQNGIVTPAQGPLKSTVTPVQGPPNSIVTPVQGPYTSHSGGNNRRTEYKQNRENNQNKQKPRDIIRSRKGEGRNELHYNGSDKNRSDSEAATKQKETKASNLSLNLNVTPRKDIHRSCISLNDNLMEHSGARHTEMASSCLDIDEDVYV